MNLMTDFNRFNRRCLIPYVPCGRMRSHCRAHAHRHRSGDSAPCGSQPEGNAAHKSTSSPIHLSVIASSGNTDTIIQRLQGMLYPGLFFFSLSTRDFSSQHFAAPQPPTHRQFEWTPSEDGERRVRCLQTKRMLGHTADIRTA